MTESYFCVDVYNPHNFAHDSSPKYDSVAECQSWIAQHLFDRGVHVEIRNITVTPVSEYDIIDSALDKGLSNSDASIASRILWDSGCIAKDYFEKHKKTDII